MNLILLASGDSKRFGSNKLLIDIGGIPMYKHMADVYERAFPFDKKIIVSKYDEVLRYMEGLGYIAIYNDNSSLGISHSIVLGIEKLCNMGNAVMFGVCDQPRLNSGSVDLLIKKYILSGKSLGTLRCGDRLGNPCIFSRIWYGDLLALRGDIGGKSIIKRNMNELCCLDVDEYELEDIDRLEDIHIIKEE